MVQKLLKLVKILPELST